VIEAVAAAGGDLGIFRADLGASGGAWWRALEGAERPKIIARLPFIERSGHPAGTPVFVIAKPLADAAVHEVTLLSLRLERWNPAIEATLARIGGDLEGSVGDEAGLSVLVSAPGEAAKARLAEALAAAGIAARALIEVGSHAARFAVPMAADPSPSVARVP
jgi:hypothetical protein